MKKKLLLLVAFLGSASALAAAPLARQPALRALHARPCVAVASAAIACPEEEQPTAARRPLLQRVAPRAAFAVGASLLVPALAVAASAAGAGEHLHLGQKIALKFSGTGLPQWAVLMLISMVPAVELRGGVPVGNWMGLSPLATLVICVIGNMVPIAPTLLGLRSNFVKKLAAPLLARAEKKLAGLPTGQSRTLALALFVGVPAPGTGAWTGAIIAYLLDMPFGEAMGAIFAGVVLAGLIMTVLTLAGKTGALIALGALLLAGAGAITTALKQEEGGAADAGEEPAAE